MKNPNSNGTKTVASKTSSSGTRSKSASAKTGHKENLAKIFEDSLKDIYWLKNTL